MIEIKEVIRRLHQTLESWDYQGWDPYDALNSPWLKIIFQKNKMAQRYAMHLVRILPFNVRPILGVKKAENPTAFFLLIEAYLNLAQATSDIQWELKALHLFDRLRKMACIDTTEELGWGRMYRYIAASEIHETGKPLAFLNLRIARCMLRLAEECGKDKLYNDIGRALRTVVNQCRIFKNEHGTFIGYSSDPNPRLIHNVNALAAAVFLRFQDYQCKQQGTSGSDTLLNTETLTRILTTVLSSQNDDGSWYYGYESDGRLNKQVDFHQGFIIDALTECIPFLSDTLLINRVKNSIGKALVFMQRYQIAPEGYFCWRYPKRFPVDIHNQAQALITLSRNRRSIPAGLLDQVAEYTISMFWGKNSGYFYYQKNRLYINRIPYLRWSQAWMMLALSELAMNT